MTLPRGSSDAGWTGIVPGLLGETSMGFLDPNNTWKNQGFRSLQKYGLQPLKMKATWVPMVVNVIGKKNTDEVFF